MNYFTQRFKQIAGVTPRQFKKGKVNETFYSPSQNGYFHLSSISHSPGCGWDFLLSI